MELQTAVRKQHIALPDYLSADRIFHFEEDAPEVILEKLIQALPLENKAAISAAIAAREKISSTILNSDIQLPHARVAGIDQIFACLGICRPTARLIFLFISPLEKTKEHLRFLSEVSALFLTENLAAALSPLNSGEEVMRHLHQIAIERKEKGAVLQHA